MFTEITFISNYVNIMLIKVVKTSVLTIFSICVRMYLENYNALVLLRKKLFKIVI